MATRGRERILEATYACVARYGLGKTTVEDAAREAGVSRATVYRHFPGGKDQLVAEVISWEATRFFVRLAQAIDGIESFPELLTQALLFAHRAIDEHEILQKILDTEPERLLPTLTVESWRLRQFIVDFLLAHVPVDGLQPGVTRGQAADYVARMLLSFTSAPGRWDLTDPDQVRELVQTELLAGILQPR